MRSIPNVSPNSYNYSEAKLHAEALDLELGFQIYKVEENIVSIQSYKVQDTQYWIGLDPQVLQTPYIEIRMILEQLKVKAGEVIVDLGAAYSRMAYVIGEHYPEVSCKTFEYVTERVIEAKRVLQPLGFKNISIEQADLTSENFQLPPADYYFLYDFGSRQAISKILQELSKIADTKSLVVIGRGRSSRDAIERQHPWLSQVYPALHANGYSLYSSYPRY
jgi:hypothetical protein